MPPLSPGDGGLLLVALGDASTTQQLSASSANTGNGASNSASSTDYVVLAFDLLAAACAVAFVALLLALLAHILRRRRHRSRRKPSDHAKALGVSVSTAGAPEGAMGRGSSAAAVLSTSVSNLAGGSGLEIMGDARKLADGDTEADETKI